MDPQEYLNLDYGYFILNGDLNLAKQSYPYPFSPKAFKVDLINGNFDVPSEFFKVCLLTTVCIQYIYITIMLYADIHFSSQPAAPYTSACIYFHH